MGIYDEIVKIYSIVMYEKTLTITAASFDVSFPISTLGSKPLTYQ